MDNDARRCNDAEAWTSWRRAPVFILWSQTVWRHEEAGRTVQPIGGPQHTVTRNVLQSGSETARAWAGKTLQWHGGLIAQSAPFISVVTSWSDLDCVCVSVTLRMSWVVIWQINKRIWILCGELWCYIWRTGFNTYQSCIIQLLNQTNNRW